MTMFLFSKQKRKRTAGHSRLNWTFYNRTDYKIDGFESLDHKVTVSRTQKWFTENALHTVRQGISGLRSACSQVGPRRHQQRTVSMFHLPLVTWKKIRVQTFPMCGLLRSWKYLWIWWMADITFERILRLVTTSDIKLKIEEKDTKFKFCI